MIAEVFMYICTRYSIELELYSRHTDMDKIGVFCFMD